MNFLQTKDGIIEFPKRKIIQGVFCHHEETLIGIGCSENGLQRISGDDYYKICKKCGKIVAEQHTQY